jgi:hypothetical protein
VILRAFGIGVGVATIVWLTVANRSPLVPLLATGGFAVSRYLRASA